ncbi:PAS domain S-box-containing protein/diguanylate cyclase (GGDEF)-like protein [Vibrio crassostreae]|uniref:sensor domain-containing diguanylate cyclase n=1 Tax=Vibrio crassostreae TaxID=246167 RepID=UPI00104424BD|nr:sensor domain-containing diguanylate cyclase [Vibrio crassostreae]TCN85589.1 PAS domain S-box-containing protein/diguanylate cyclase (GGDEF)-like protein [Vibrio crassostreae]
MNKLNFDRRAPLYVVSALVLNTLVSLWLLSTASTAAMVFSVCALFLLSTLITARLYRHEMTQSQNSLSEAIIDGVAGFIILDSQLRIIQVNQQFSRVSGYAFDQVEARPISDLCFMNNSSLISTISTSLKQNHRWKGELSGVSRLGEHFTVNVVVEKLTELLPHNEKYVVTFTDISRRKILERRLRMLVETDSLTGCWNRRRFDKDLNHYSNLAERYGYTQSCLALIDLDHFKSINDNHGHDQGDAALKEVAELLRNNSRDTDIVARVGGEEFAILMPETNLADAFEAMYRLKEVITKGTTLNLTVSSGVSEIQAQAEATYRSADRALYRAKGNGRNRVCSSSSGIPAPIVLG